MFKSVKEFNIKMFEILTMVLSGNLQLSIAENANDTNFHDALARCIKLGYILGIEECLSLGQHCSDYIFSEQIRISYEGLQFLESQKI
jgi:hypothetical protein